MAKTITFKALGLYTYPNQFSAPEGAMSAALDVFIDRPGIIEARRDYANSSFTYTLDSPHTGTADAWHCPDFASSVTKTPVFAQEFRAGGLGSSVVCGNIFDCTSGHKYRLIDNANTVTSIVQRVITVMEANGNIYFATGRVGSGNEGAVGPSTVYRLSAENGDLQARGAGMPEAPVPTIYFNAATNPDGFRNTTPTGAAAPASTILKQATVAGVLTDYQRAYRVLFLYKDSYNNLVRGPPSGRMVVTNPGHEATPSAYGIQIFGTSNLYAGDIVQLYASEIASFDDSIGTTGEPSDDMRLVYEYIIQPADITRGYIGINDITPDALRGAALYTNDTQDGILQAESAPPSAAYCTLFKNVAWYGGVNHTGHSDLVVNIIGLDGWVAATTTFTVNSIVYPSAATEDLTTTPPTWGLFTAGSAAQNLFNTARSICRAINFKNASTLAVFASSPNSTSASIIIKYFGTDNSGPTRTVSSNATAGTISPNLPANTVLEKTANRLYYSKPNQPEAVPATNYVQVGSPGSKIVALAWLRDSLFVFKREGLFRVTGTSSADIRVELFDATVSTSPGQHRSIAKAGNQIFAVCNQGVVSITESGVSVISRAIEDLLRPYLTIYNSSDYSSSITGVNSFWTCSASASESERKYFLSIVKGSSANTPANGNLLYAYNFVNNVWTQMTPPVANNTVGVLTVPTPGTSDQVLFCSLSQSTLLLMSRITDTNPVYVNSATWTYAGGMQTDPGTLRRYRDVKILTNGSASMNQLSVTFSSDSGASPATVTVTPPNTNVVVVQVPRAHSLCGQLFLKITGPTSGHGLFQVQEVQAVYEDAGDWVGK